MNVDDAEMPRQRLHHLIELFRPRIKIMEFPGDATDAALVAEDVVNDIVLTSLDIHLQHYVVHRSRRAVAFDDLPKTDIQRAAAVGNTLP